MIFIAKDTRSRKYLLTINNPIDHGYPHEQIRQNLEKLTGLDYWCMCDEIGEKGTPHTHIFICSENAMMWSTVKKYFYHADIEKANGSPFENRTYIRKEGKWKDTNKFETNLPETFEEWGEMPDEKTKKETVTEAIYRLVKDGATDAEILEQYPIAMRMLPQIVQTRQVLHKAQYSEEYRQLEVTYIWGPSRSGKTSYVIKKHGYSNVYRVTDYKHPFDGYDGQPVILFDEFRSDICEISISAMLNYLDGHPTELPARYANRFACYTTVYIVSNIPIEKQYPDIQSYQRESWNALLRRITHIKKIDDISTQTVTAFTEDFNLDDFEELPCDSAEELQLSLDSARKEINA